MMQQIILLKLITLLKKNDGVFVIPITSLKN